MAKSVDDIIKMTERREVKTILGQVALEEQRHRQTLLELRDVIGHITGVTEDAPWNYLNRWANFSTQMKASGEMLVGRDRKRLVESNSS